MNAWYVGSTGNHQMCDKCWAAPDKETETKDRKAITRYLEGHIAGLARVSAF